MVNLPKPICILLIFFFLSFSHSYSQDLLIEKLIIPEPKTTYNSSESITLNIVNTTDKILSNVVVEVSLSGLTNKITESVGQSVGAYDTLEYTLSSSFDLSGDGIYEFSAALIYEGNYKSNEVKASTINLPVYTKALPIKFDFENFKECEVFQIFMDESRLPGIGFYTNNTNAEMILGPSSYGSINNFTLNENSETNFIFTVDLAEYDVQNDDLMLEAEHFNLNSENEMVLVRGSEQDHWVSMLSYSKSISSLLHDNGQEFSGTTQILFRSVLGEIEKQYSHYATFIDNLKIYFKPQYDVALESATIPSPKFGQTQNEKISVVVINTGAQRVSQIPVKCLVNTPSETIVHSEVIEQAIAPSDTLRYTFKRTFDFSEVGFYSVEFETELPSDEDMYNNNFKAQTLKFDNYKGGYPLVEDFNDVSLKNRINYLTKNESLPGVSFYGNSESSYLKFKETDQTNRTKVTLNASNNGTYANMLYTLDLNAYKSKSEDLLLSFESETQYEDFGTPELGDVMVRGNENEKWLPLYMHYNWGGKYSHNITRTLRENGQDFSDNTQIIFRIPENRMSNWTSHYFTLDNIKIYFLYSDDAGVKEIITPRTDVHLSETSLMVEILNEGKNTIEKIPIVLEVHSPSGQVEVYEHVIDTVVHQERSFRFESNHLFTLEEEGEYLVKAIIKYPNDSNRYNDTLTTKIIKPKVYRGSYPYVQDFNLVNPFMSESSATDIAGMEGFTAITEFGILGVNPVGNGAGNIFEFNCSRYSGNEMLLFTADASGENVTSINLEFDYFASDHRNGYFELWCRGNADEDWIVHEMSASPPFEFQNESKDLLELITSHNQKPGSTFQVAFVANMENVRIDNFKFNVVNFDEQFLVASKEEFIQPKIIIYPNPGSETLKISKEDFIIDQLAIFNSNGIIVKSFNSDVQEINISNLKRGLYILRIESENRVFVKQIIIN